MRAVVFTDSGLEVRDDVSVRAPGPTEVVVRVTAAGACHSDLKLVNGTTAYPRPVVMGHEGTGVVDSVGVGVSGVRPGDTVVIHTLRFCGRCRHCASGQPTRCAQSMGAIGAPFTMAGSPAYQFANTSVFVERTVVDQQQVVKIDPVIPSACAALLGCGVLTGVGAVRNRARVGPGDTVVVFGIGGVGLNVVQGARLAAAARIVAVDTNPAKEGIARTFGATDFLASADATEAVLELVPGGVDHAFVCIGSPALVRAGADVLAWGGQCVIVGFPGPGTDASFEVARMYHDKSILGCRYGSSSPHRDIALLADLYLDGRLLLDELVTHTIPLADAATAFADMTAGRVDARTVLTI
jgi:Zn-dependent alcohol dehydrogenase